MSSALTGHSPGNKLSSELTKTSTRSIYSSQHLPSSLEHWELQEVGASGSPSVLHLPPVWRVWCSRYVPLRGGPGDGPGHAGGTMSLGWPGNALGSTRRSWRRCLGERDVWVSLLSLLPLRPGPR
ncbi:hypothetical protein ATANTOWER_014298 [Ataeniobius toweri]|uniref:Uncharacterized protein n=1 Tax=Ataeniobius toweri TaxID=208326 RepID=A0ABU7AF43_9TELE|nr:hypothetical protein [Ataeniobius toweri]